MKGDPTNMSSNRKYRTCKRHGYKAHQPAPLYTYIKTNPARDRTDISCKVLEALNLDPNYPEPVYVCMHVTRNGRAVFKRVSMEEYNKAVSTIKERSAS